VALLAPLAGVVVAFAAADPDDVARWTTAGCATSAAIAIALLVFDRHPHVGRIEPDALALAATAATALLAIGLRRRVGPATAAAVTIATAFLGSATTTAGRAELVVVASAVVATVAALQPARFPTLVVPSALVSGLRAAPMLVGTTNGRAVAIGLALAATALALI